MKFCDRIIGLHVHFSPPPGWGCPVRACVAAIVVGPHLQPAYPEGKEHDPEAAAWEKRAEKPRLTLAVIPDRERDIHGWNPHLPLILFDDVPYSEEHADESWHWPEREADA